MNTPIQVRSATVQHRQHGGQGKGSGSRALVAGGDASAASTLEADRFSCQTLPCCICGFLAVRWRTILAWDSKSHGGTMPEGYLHLTCEQRCQIYALLQSGHSQAHIARKI